MMMNCRTVCFDGTCQFCTIFSAPVFEVSDSGSDDSDLDPFEQQQPAPLDSALASALSTAIAPASGAATNEGTSADSSGRQSG